MHRERDSVWRLLFLKALFATNISSSDIIRSKMKEEVQLSNDPWKYLTLHKKVNCEVLQTYKYLRSNKWMIFNCCFAQISVGRWYTYFNILCVKREESRLLIQQSQRFLGNVRNWSKLPLWAINYYAQTFLSQSFQINMEG